MAEEENAPPAKKGGLKLSKGAKIGIGVGGLAAVYLYYRHQQNQAIAAASTASPTDTTATGAPADTGVALGTDTGPGSYGTNYSAASSSTVGNVSTNQDWFSAALQAAENAGYDAQTASVALSAFLGSQPLTAQQQQIVRIGLAAAGQPPQGPTGIVTAPVPPAGGSGTPAPVTAPTGLSLRALGNTYATVAWNGQPNAHGYYLYTNGVRSPLLFGTLYTLNTANAGTPIKPSSRYAVQATAVDSSGQESGKSATLNVTTKK